MSSVLKIYTPIIVPKVRGCFEISCRLDQQKFLFPRDKTSLYKPMDVKDVTPEMGLFYSQGP